MRLTAQIGSLVATWAGCRPAAGRFEPDPALGHAANFLYMLTGERPSALATRAFDVALMLHADHELNASTFAARVAAATLTDIHSAIVGGDRRAQGAAARRRQRRRDAAAARDRAGRDRPRRVDEVDPRQAGAQGEDSRLRPPRLSHRGSARDAPAADVRRARRSAPAAALVRDVAAHRGARQGEKKLNPNVDFYSASTYYALGIPIDLFTPIFAVSRISGWTAHVLEQYANNRLIRPRADYIGPAVPAAIRAARRER